MGTVKVFRSREAVKSKNSTKDVGITAMVKYGRLACLEQNEMDVLISENDIYFLVQGNYIIGMAFDSDDANKGFRIMAHEQYRSGYFSEYPIEVIHKNDLEFEYWGYDRYSLIYVYI